MSDKSPAAQSGRKRKIGLATLVGLLCLLLVALFLWRQPVEIEATNESGVGVRIDPNAEEWRGELPTEKVGGEDEADVTLLQLPGYTALDFVAGETQQAVSFVNPEENPCYITIGLSVNGKTVYTSGLIPPELGLYSIELAEPFEPGNYSDALLHYRCFSLEDGETEYNGANMELEIRVA